MSKTLTTNNGKVLVSGRKRPPTVFTQLYISGVAHVRRIYSRAAQSVISMQQRAPGIWSVSASNQINLIDVAGPLHILLHSAASPLWLTHSIDIAKWQSLSDNIVYDEHPTVTPSESTIQLEYFPVLPNTLRLYKNGMRMFPGSDSDFILDAITGLITFNKSLSQNDQIVADYHYT